MAFGREDFACLSPKLLRNIPGTESQSVSRGSMQTKIRNAGAQKRQNHEKIKRSSTTDFLAGYDVCNRIFGAS
jgi:hypothetical protein